jgi:hypothetical protein
MKIRGLVVTLGLLVLVFELLAFAPRGVTPPARVVLAAPEPAVPHCVPVGGTMMTDLAVIDEFTTLGISTGDIRGGLSATIQNVNGTDFTVLHHIVTDAGEIITFNPVLIRAVSLNGSVFGVFSPSPLQITGGTGKFEGATGQLNAMGAVSFGPGGSLVGGKTVFRYTGQVCFAARDND